MLLDPRTEDTKGRGGEAQRWGQVNIFNISQIDQSVAEFRLIKLLKIVRKLARLCRGVRLKPAQAHEVGSRLQVVPIIIPSPIES